MGSLECRPIEKIPMGCVRLHLRSTNSIKEPYGIGKVQRGRLPPKGRASTLEGSTMHPMVFNLPCRLSLKKIH